MEPSSETQKQKVVPQLEVRVLKSLVDMEKNLSRVEGSLSKRVSFSERLDKKQDTVGACICGEGGMKKWHKLTPMTSYISLR